MVVFGLTTLLAIGKLVYISLALTQVIAITFKPIILLQSLRVKFVLTLTFNLAFSQSLARYNIIDKQILYSLP